MREHDNSADNSGFQLFTAVKQGNLHQAENLIDSSSGETLVEMLCYQQKNENRETISSLFHAVAEGGYSEIAEHIATVVTSIADESSRIAIKQAIEQENTIGRTALHHATTSGYYSMCRAYMDMGANPAPSTRGTGQISESDALIELQETPVEIAIRNGDGAIFLLFASEMHQRQNPSPAAYKNTLDQTLLHIAASSGREDIAGLLMDSFSADSALSDGNGHTPLYTAALNGHGKVVEKILAPFGEAIPADKRRPLPIIPYDSMGRTPFHAAASNNYPQIVTQLAHYWKGNISDRDQSGNTALHLAINRINITAAQTLLDEGIDYTLANKEGKTALDLVNEKLGRNNNSAERRKLRQIRGVLQGKNAQHTVPLYDSSPHSYVNSGNIFTEVQSGHIDNVQQILSLHTGNALELLLLSEDEKGNTPLHLAARGGFVEIVNVLLKPLSSDKQRELTTVINKNGYTALHYSARENFVLTTTALLGAGADPLAGMRDGMVAATPLAFAARMGAPEMVTRLNAALKDHSNEELARPELILQAVRNGRTEAALLLANDDPALFYAKDAYGQTAFHKVSFAGWNETLQMMVDTTRRRYGEEAVKEALCASDKLGRTPLHFAASNNHVDIVRWLLEQDGVDINAQDNTGRTPLHMAAHKGQNEAITALCTQGADRTIKNSSHKTAHRVVLEKVENFKHDRFIRSLRDSSSTISTNFITQEKTRLDASLTAIQRMEAKKVHYDFLPSLLDLETIHRTLEVGALISAGTNGPSYSNFAISMAQGVASLAQVHYESGEKLQKNQQLMGVINERQEHQAFPLFNLQSFEPKGHPQRRNLQLHAALFGAVALVNMVGIATGQYDNDDTPISESKFKQALLATTILATLGSSLINRAINNRLDDKAKQLERISELQHNMAHPYPTPELREEKVRSWAEWGQENWDGVASAITAVRDRASQGMGWVGNRLPRYAQVRATQQDEGVAQQDVQMVAMEEGWMSRKPHSSSADIPTPSCDKQPLGYFTKQELRRERSNSVGGKEGEIA